MSTLKGGIDPTHMRIWRQRVRVSSCRSTVGCQAEACSGYCWSQKVMEGRGVWMGGYSSNSSTHSLTSTHLQSALCAEPKSPYSTFAAILLVGFLLDFTMGGAARRAETERKKTSSFRL